MLPVSRVFAVIGAQHPWETSPWGHCISFPTYAVPKEMSPGMFKFRLKLCTLSTFHLIKYLNEGHGQSQYFD